MKNTQFAQVKVRIWNTLIEIIPGLPGVNAQGNSVTYDSHKKQPRWLRQFDELRHQPWAII